MPSFNEIDGIFRRNPPDLSINICDPVAAEAGAADEDGRCCINESNPKIPTRNIIADLNNDDDAILVLCVGDELMLLVVVVVVVVAVAVGCPIILLVVLFFVSHYIYTKYIFIVGAGDVKDIGIINHHKLLKAVNS
jgi:hypothetical protein